MGGISVNWQRTKKQKMLSNSSKWCVCGYVLTDPEHQDTRTVEFTKGPNDSLGISIAGGVGSPLGDIPIFIAMMNPVGLAAQTQKLKVQDSQPLIDHLCLQQENKTMNLHSSSPCVGFNVNLLFTPVFMQLVNLWRLQRSRAYSFSHWPSQGNWQL